MEALKVPSFLTMEGYLMKRLIDYYLRKWKQSEERKPLLLRGARQVGKTYAVRQLGDTFESFVEVNFELTAHARDVFEIDLEPERIIRDLSMITGKQIIPGKTLLFFDFLSVKLNFIIINNKRRFYEAKKTH